MRTNFSDADSGSTLAKNLVIAGVLLVFSLFVIVSAITSFNYAVAQESTIRANRDSAKNVLGQYAPMLKEAIGVTQLQADDLREVFEASNESRYGANGTSAAVQFIQEQNPQLDQSNYGRIINLIEAGRRDFRNAQEQQIDRVRAYRTGSQQFPKAVFLPMFGKPTPGFFEEFEKIVVSDHASEAYTTGIDDGVDVGKLNQRAPEKK
jgi:hypothetical protein